VRLGAVAAVVLAAPAAATAAPTISGANGDVWNAEGPAPTYTVGSTEGARVQWRLDGGAWSAAQASPLVLPLGPLADGDHVLAARETTLLGLLVPVQRRFLVDTTAPRIDLRTPVQGAVYAQGQAVAASYSCTGAVTCAGPVPSGQPVPTAAPGPATFRVRATDDAGNTATARADYGVAAPGQTTPAGPGRPAQVIRLAPQAPPKVVLGVPQTLNARRLRPAAGRNVTAPRDLTLRWRPRAGARLYNVQMWVVEGTRLRKFVSRFPREASFRVPAGALSPGHRYVWRAWPYLARGYAKAPVGLSWFDVERPVRLSAGQLLATQRIAQSALRRVAAVEAWLDAGLTGGDLRDGALGRAAFASGVSLSGAGTPIANGLATPRPVVEPPPPRARRAPRVAVTARQLLVNQRIGQTALRRAAALERRLSAGLTGGDLHDGAITASKLAPGLFVAGAGAPQPVAASVSRVAPARAGSGGRVRMTDRQAQINLRISRAALRTANALLALARGGLSGAQFRAGTIGAAKLSDELR
jgi:hypothetical protein